MTSKEAITYTKTMLKNEQIQLRHCQYKQKVNPEQNWQPMIDKHKYNVSYLKIVLRKLKYDK